MGRQHRLHACADLPVVVIYAYQVGCPIARQDMASLDRIATAHQTHARMWLLDATADLPLFRYWRDAPGGGDVLAFGRVVRLGSIEAIRRRLLDGAGVAVVPAYLVQEDLRARRLRRVFSSVEPQHDWFRLVFRADDPRRAAYALLADAMREAPLR